MMRLRSSRMSSGSHLSRFQTLFNFLLKFPWLDSNSPYLSSVFSSSSRTFRQLPEISCRSVFCWSLSSRSERTTSTSWRTIERLLTLVNQGVSNGQPYAQVTHSSEMSLNWLGAPTNSFRILLASSIAVMKSLILNPKLILTFALPLSSSRQVQSLTAE
jgi:hypothetical protein